MVEQITHVFLSNASVGNYGFVLLMDRDDDIDKAINDRLDIIWLLIHFYAICNF